MVVVVVLANVGAVGVVLEIIVVAREGWLVAKVVCSCCRCVCESKSWLLTLELDVVEVVGLEEMLIWIC